MATQIDKDAVAILEILANAPRDQHFKGEEIAGQAELDPGRVNDAVAILVDSGYAEWTRWMGTAPFDFGQVTITSRGRYEAQRRRFCHGRAYSPRSAARGSSSRCSSEHIASPITSRLAVWIHRRRLGTAAERRSRRDRLYTVPGHQFSSEFFETPRLRENVAGMLERAVNAYNKDPGGPTVYA